MMLCNSQWLYDTECTCDGQTGIHYIHISLRMLHILECIIYISVNFRNHVELYCKINVHKTHARISRSSHLFSFLYSSEFPSGLIKFCLILPLSSCPEAGLRGVADSAPGQPRQPHRPDDGNAGHGRVSVQRRADGRERVQLKPRRLVGQRPKPAKM